MARLGWQHLDPCNLENTRILHISLKGKKARKATAIDTGTLNPNCLRTGGLTEEEVAAFKAQHPAAPPCQTASASKGKHCTPPQRIPVRTNGAGARLPSGARVEPQSFHSEMEFSDSDSGL